MKRSKWKEMFVANQVLKFSSLFDKKMKTPKIFSRSSTILSDFLDKEVFVYNGLAFKKFLVKKEMIGHKFGEFVRTRKFPEHKKKKKKK